MSSLLICQRLADMQVMHPEQVTRACAWCDAPVGIFPTGQRALKGDPRLVIVCQVCRPPENQVRGVRMAARSRGEFVREQLEARRRDVD